MPLNINSRMSRIEYPSEWEPCAHELAWHMGYHKNKNKIKEKINRSRQ